jgi:predicted GNAT family N-acyltransferase
MVSIRQGEQRDLLQIRDWCKAEEWDTGVLDVDKYYVMDPTGYFVAEKDGQLIGSISLVQCSANLLFVGSYICKKEFRGQGIGSKLWSFAWARKNADKFNVGLDCDLHLVGMYQKRGFKPYHCDNLYRLSLSPQKSTALPALDGINIRVFDIENQSPVSLEQLSAFDSQYYFEKRTKFLQEWCADYRTLVALDSHNTIVGYTAIRPIVTGGYKIGPTYATNINVAINLIVEQIQEFDETEKIYLDIPELNPNLSTLIDLFGLKLVSKCVKMYTKYVPDVPFDKIFAITSLGCFG